MRIKPVLLGLTLYLAAVLQGCVAYVRPVPPPPRYAVVGVAPRPGWVWREGFYQWNGAAYVWTPGVWVRPPRPHAVWVPGYWVQRPRGWVYVRGRWR